MPLKHCREILPDKFNLKAAFEKWSNDRNLCEMKTLLDESKKRISLSLVQACEEQANRDAFIICMVLQAICEEVTLTLADVKIDSNVHTFVNIAVIWALSEMNIVNYDNLCTEQLRSHEDLVYYLCNGTLPLISSFFRTVYFDGALFRLYTTGIE